MKIPVGDLIAHTTWSPPRMSEPPVVSVLLPVFRRNADGTLSRAIESILDQTFHSLELIIVDDGSTDGSGDTARKFAATDARVGVLSHAANIGLPAISEYEAYMRARGDLFLFAFDDFIFKPDALQQLVTAARQNPERVVHGYASLSDPDGGVIRLGTGHQHDKLLLENYIANSSFLLPRSVIEDIGLYDPHALASRLCDWDLLRRIHQRYPLLLVDVDVGTEHGAARNDSLGNTYPMFFDVMDTYFARDRNAELRPANFASFDVWGVRDDEAAAVELATVNTQEHFLGKSWAPPRADVIVDDRQRKCVVGVLGDFDASTMLFFEGLEAHVSLVFLGHEPLKHGLSILLTGLDAVIVVRELFGRGENVATQCRALSVPCYYFCDDNFVELAKVDRRYAAYSQTRVRDALRNYAGVLCSNKALAEYFSRLAENPAVHIRSVFSDNRWHKCQLVRRAALAKRDSQRLRIGFIGNEARIEAFRNVVAPCLAKLAAIGSIEVYVRAGAAIEGAPGMNVVEVPVLPNFDAFMTHWSGLALDLLVHPESTSINTPYKAENVLLVAAYLGAVPILFREPAFAEISDHDVPFARDGDDLLTQLTALRDEHRRAEAYAKVLAAAQGQSGNTTTRPEVLDVLDTLQRATAAKVWARCRRVAGTGGALGPGVIKLALLLRRGIMLLRPFGVLKLARFLSR